MDAKRLYGRPRRKPPTDLTQSYPPSPQEWVCIGEIVAPFGLHGDVKLVPQTDFPERIAHHKQLYVSPDYHPLSLGGAHSHGGVILLHFTGIDTIEAAETLRNLRVFIPQHEIAPLPANHYYIHDLIGLQAVHVNGTALGTIADVYAGNAQDLLVIRRPGQPEVLVPLVKALVPSVDIAHRIVTIDPPGGLFDDQPVDDDE